MELKNNLYAEKQAGEKLLRYKKKYLRRVNPGGWSSTAGLESNHHVIIVSMRNQFEN